MAKSEFDAKDIFALSNVTRWHHTATKRRQSVAEHSYNVAMLAQRIAAEIDMIPPHFAWVATAALVHDLPEVDFGDIPAPTKLFLDHNLGSLESIDECTTAMFYLRRKMSPPPIPRPVHELVKLADLLEALIWYVMNGDQKGRWGCPDIVEAMKHSLRKRLTLHDEPTRTSVLGILAEVDIVLYEG